MKYTTVTIVLIFICYPVLFSQTVPNITGTELKTFGIGIGFRAPIATGYVEPAANIILTMNISNKFRIEPELGFAFENNEEKNDYSSKDHVYLLSINGLAIIEKGNVGILAGPKIGFLKDYREYTQFTFSAIDNDRKSIFVGPVFGLEYYFTSYLSISGEFAAIYIRSFGSNYSDNEINNHAFRSDATLKIHIYLNR